MPVDVRGSIQGREFPGEAARTELPFQHPGICCGIRVPSSSPSSASQFSLFSHPRGMTLVGLRPSVKLTNSPHSQTQLPPHLPPDGTQVGPAVVLSQTTRVIQWGQPLLRSPPRIKLLMSGVQSYCAHSMRWGTSVPLARKSTSIRSQNFHGKGLGLALEHCVTGTSSRLRDHRQVRTSIPTSRKQESQ